MDKDSRVNTPAGVVAGTLNRLRGTQLDGTKKGLHDNQVRSRARLIAENLLPRDVGQHRPTLEQIGFVFGAEVDDLLIEATLPPGWTKVAGDSDIHVTLLDDKGRERGFMLYKTAFHDRKADLRLETRYSLETDSDETDPLILKLIVIDFDRVTVLYHSEPVEWTEANEKAAWATARAWLKEHRPDWENPAAYWD